MFVYVRNTGNQRHNTIDYNYLPSLIFKKSKIIIHLLTRVQRKQRLTINANVRKGHRKGSRQRGGHATCCVHLLHGIVVDQCLEKVSLQKLYALPQPLASVPGGEDAPFHINCQIQHLCRRLQKNRPRRLGRRLPG